MKQTPPTRRTGLRSDPDKAREFVERGRASSARSLGRGARRRGGISPASEAQREKVRGRSCLRCVRGERDGVKVDPAHVIPRGMGGCDDALCVVPLCRECHRAYDDGDLDLLPYLEPRWRREVGHAVEHVGLVAALGRVTNARWGQCG